MVTVIIPTYNRAVDLRNTLLSLNDQTFKDFSVIVVNNSSTDNTAQVVNECRTLLTFPLTYHVKVPQGPASARNWGLAAARTEYVLFLDSDVELKSKWIETALAHMDGNITLAAAGGQIRYSFNPDKLNAYGGTLGYFGLAWDIREGENADGHLEKESRSWINCSAMLARTEACRRVEGFDDTFFYGYEDSDIGWKLNISGMDVCVFPDLIALHKVKADAGRISPDIVFHYCKNRLRSLLKNADTLHLPVKVSLYLAYSMADLILKPHRMPKLKAFYWNIAHLKETFILRKKINKIRKKK